MTVSLVGCSVLHYPHLMRLIDSAAKTVRLGHIDSCDPRALPCGDYRSTVEDAEVVALYHGAPWRTALCEYNRIFSFVFQLRC